MGQRRVRHLLRRADGPVIAGVNRSSAKREAAEKEFGIATYADVDAAIADFRPDVAFVCTAPALHGPTVLACLRAGLDVFMELNLVGPWYDEAIEIIREKKLTTYVAATPLHRREMKYVTEAVRETGPACYMMHGGAYLPDWHPWQDYHEFFAAKAETNGVREIFAVEFPWLERCFGRVKDFTVTKGRRTTLDIDYPDFCMVTLEHEGGSVGMYCQDVVCRRGERRLEVFSENLHLFWEGTPDSLRRLDLATKRLEDVNLYETAEHDARYNASVIEDMYADEIDSFFDCVALDAPGVYTLEDDRRTLELIDRIEGVAR